MIKYLLFTPAVFLLSCGGSSEDELDYEETEYDIKIKDYLADKDWDVERQESGLYIYVEEEGSEEKPTQDSYMKIIYEGRLLDGTVFDGTNGESIEFGHPLDYTIAGWREGIPHFGRGGKGTLIIPPDMGYGEEDMGPIPGNSVIVFDIEVVDFGNSPPPPPDYSEEIITYMEMKDMDTSDAIVTPSGLYVLIEKEGGESKPSVHDYVTIHYTGRLTNDNKFDGTEGEPATFLLGNLIAGWKEGIPYFGEGGKGKLIIPPYLGYGSRDTPDIPANSVLVFDIELVSFSATPPEEG
ncbi:MAG: FKBP-type peptidyl-prolyl cis-trans isomerase [Crocinitomicaceae bacterium]|nr:FKBP-type peptidyl-prolyl cis-trans isomerase [Crocinitomicaceae bacterium]